MLLTVAVAVVSGYEGHLYLVVIFMNIEYVKTEPFYGDYYGDGFELICIYEKVQYKLLIFSTDNFFDTKEKIVLLNKELNKMLSYIKANEISIRKNAVDENYDWLFEELICDSDYYLENGNISKDEVAKFTHLAWIKIFCEQDKIKSFHPCFEETEAINCELLGGHTFGIEIVVSGLY